MKVGFICVMHKCNQCSRNTFDTINNFNKSLWEFCKKDFTLYLFDNASDEHYNYVYHPNLQYYYIENQKKRGLAGPYNDGIRMAIKQNCDIIALINDDVILNDTVNTFFDIINKHPDKNISLFGPLTNGVNSNFQKADTRGDGIIEITNRAILNGFFVAFTKKFYERFKKKNGDLCESKLLWEGGERALRDRIVSNGGKLFVIKNCWFEHRKIGGWRGL